LKAVEFTVDFGFLLLYNHLAVILDDGNIPESSPVQLSGGAGRKEGVCHFQSISFVRRGREQQGYANATGQAAGKADASRCYIGKAAALPVIGDHGKYVERTRMSITKVTVFPTTKYCVGIVIRERCRT
jgi:hypothetical protein